MSEDANSTTEAAGAPQVGVADRVSQWLGETNAERPQPNLMSAFAGIGGSLAGFGLLMVISGDGDSQRGAIVAGSLITMALALGLRLLPTPAPAKAAAVGMSVVAIPAFAIAATVGGDDANFLTGAVMAALSLTAWALPGFRHRHVLLGIGALALISAFGSLSAPDHNTLADRCNAYANEGDWESFDAECNDVYYYDDSSSFLPAGLTDNLGEQGAIYLAGAVLCFGSTWWLDRRQRRGPGAALCTAGLLSSVAGTTLLAADLGDDAGPVFVAIVGLLVCVVGTHGSRRATTWWGAAMASVGLVWFVMLQATPDSTRSIGGAIIIAGALLVGIAAVARWGGRREAVSQTPTPPALEG